MAENVEERTLKYRVEMDMSGLNTGQLQAIDRYVTGAVQGAHPYTGSPPQNSVYATPPGHISPGPAMMSPGYPHTAQTYQFPYAPIATQAIQTAVAGIQTAGTAAISAPVQLGSDVFRFAGSGAFPQSGGWGTPSAGMAIRSPFQAYMSMLDIRPNPLQMSRTEMQKAAGGYLGDFYKGLGWGAAEVAGTAGFFGAAAAKVGTFGVGAAKFAGGWALPAAFALEMGIYATHGEYNRRKEISGALRPTLDRLGIGTSSGNLTELSSSMRALTAGTGDMGHKDLMKILESPDLPFMMQGTSDINTFKDKFRKLIDNARQMAIVLRTSLEQGAEIAKELQGAGIQPGSIIRTGIGMQSVAQMTGYTTGEVASASLGAMRGSRSMGLGAGFGAAIMETMTPAADLAYKQGGLGADYVALRGGTAGVAMDMSRSLGGAFATRGSKAHNVATAMIAYSLEKNDSGQYVMSQERLRAAAGMGGALVSASGANLNAIGLSQEAFFNQMPRRMQELGTGGWMSLMQGAASFAPGGNVTPAFLRGMYGLDRERADALSTMYGAMTTTAPLARQTRERDTARMYDIERDRREHVWSRGWRTIRYGLTDFGDMFSRDTLTPSVPSGGKMVPADTARGYISGLGLLSDEELSTGRKEYISTGAYVRDGTSSAALAHGGLAYALEEVYGAGFGSSAETLMGLGIMADGDFSTVGGFSATRSRVAARLEDIAAASGKIDREGGLYKNSFNSLSSNVVRKIARDVRGKDVGGAYKRLINHLDPEGVFQPGSHARQMPLYTAILSDIAPGMSAGDITGALGLPSEYTVYAGRAARAREAGIAALEPVFWGGEEGIYENRILQMGRSIFQSYGGEGAKLTELSKLSDVQYKDQILGIMKGRLNTEQWTGLRDWFSDKSRDDMQNIRTAMHHSLVEAGAEAAQGIYPSVGKSDHGGWGGGSEGITDKELAGAVKDYLGGAGPMVDAMKRSFDEIAHRLKP